MSFRGKKKKLMVSALLVLVIVLSMPAIACAGSVSRTYSGQFEEAWNSSYTEILYHPTLHTYQGKMTIYYGFNTLLINEDVCTSICEGWGHNARIINGRGTFDGPTRVSNEYSDIQVRHSGTSVTYVGIYND